jgi:hypothetical protein
LSAVQARNAAATETWYWGPQSAINRENRLRIEPKFDTVHFM